MDDTHFDAVIIGSGFGGSVMAYRLAEAGLKVCLLERGKAYPPFSFPRAPYKVRDNFWDPSEGLYGLYNVWSFKGSGALVSSGLGGGSLIYANIIIRKDDKWFVHEDLNKGGYEDWPITRADLERHYDTVDEMMNVQKYPFHLKPYNKTAKTQAMSDAADVLNKKNDLKEKDKRETIEWKLLNLAVSFRKQHAGGKPCDPPDDINNPPVTGEPVVEPYGTNYHGKTRYTCVLCGECDFGCNTGSKNTLDYTYITAAQHTGHADIRTLCEVKSFAPIIGGDGGYEVRYVEHDPDKWREVRDRDDSYRVPYTTHKITAKRLIVSAGAYGSPYLLLKNRESFPHLKTNQNLGTKFGLNGDMLSFLVKSQEKKNGRCASRILDPNFGPVITSAIRLGDTLDGNGDQGRGFYVEDGGNPYLLSWGAELADSAKMIGRVLHLGKRYLQYRFNLNNDADLDKEIADVLGECAASKSSLPILTMGRDFADGNLTLTDDGKLACDWTIKKSRKYYDRVLRIGRGIASAIHAEYMENPLYEYFRQVMTAHPLGGCPMGRDKKTGVVDSWGEVFGHPGLYVLDGSIMPGPVGPNPSMTIAAISDRAAEHIIEQHKGVI
jgi:cholesterol oxidase